MKLAIKSPDEIVSKLGQVVYVAGSQWGDEGKGKLVDIMSQYYDIIARAAGGANAGHTIVVKKGDQSERFVFHLLPSGVLHEGKKCVIGNGTVIHIPTLLEELETLKEKGVDAFNNILLSDRAHIIFDYHLEIDGIQEQRKGDKKVGTTKRGIGPCYTDKISRRGIRMGDLLNFDAFAEKFRENAERNIRLFGIEIDIEEQINFYKDAADLLEPLIINTMEYLNDAHKAGKSILVEGAQGSHLDIDFGTYPFVTSSNTTAGGACTGLGLAPSKVSSCVGIVKAYTTRVGAGPFPTELHDEEGDKLRKLGDEFGATTGRPRRCGWFDTVVAKNAIILNGTNSVNITKLDVLSDLESIRIGIAYKLDGKEIKFIPASLAEFEKVEVEYIDMPGWKEDISKAETFEDLPENAQKYIEKLEELLEVPVNFIGVGVHRNELVYR
jgi:adenylosuccinate synthase